MCAIEIEPTLRTSRLRLRKPRLSDAGTVASLCNDFDLARMTAAIPYPYALADAEGFLRHLGKIEPLGVPTYAIEHVDQGFMGMMGFHTNDAGYPELGYWLGRPFWGQGYATEAAKCALDWAKRVWRRRFVVAGHFDDNPASGEVLIKSGFLYTGEVKLQPSAARNGDVPVRMMVWLA